MALVLELFLQILRKPTVVGIFFELLLLAAPLWLAVFVGVFIGWLWRPKWASGLNTMHVSHGATTISSNSTSTCNNCSKALVIQPSFSEDRKEEVGVIESQDELAVRDEDLAYLSQLVEETDGGLTWIKMMEKSLPTFFYQAWRREPRSGPLQYRSSTVFEDATTETVRDFFWDDEFRISNRWDDMLLQHRILEECSETGTLIMHWVRKFPFFCSDREYIIGRRIWNSGRTFYCVTKGIPYPSVPRQSKPRRVDKYYSSWCIRPVASKRDGQMTACEVLLFHFEDMGIPREIAKIGIRQGMWGCVKKIEPGLRDYQAARRANEPISHYASMAQINTKFDADQLISIDNGVKSSSDIVETEKKHWFSNIPKFLVIGSAVALACSLDRGLVTKAVVFGVARRFAGQQKKL